MKNKIVSNIGIDFFKDGADKFRSPFSKILVEVSQVIGSDLDTLKREKNELASISDPDFEKQSIKEICSEIAVESVALYAISKFNPLSEAVCISLSKKIRLAIERKADKSIKDQDRQALINVFSRMEALYEKVLEDKAPIVEKSIGIMDLKVFNSLCEKYYKELKGLFFTLNWESKRQIIVKALEDSIEEHKNSISIYLNQKGRESISPPSGGFRGSL